MPPRLVTGAILLFWLAMTGWLIQQEVVPMMLAEVSPSYQPDLTEEIGSPLVGWNVMRDGKRIGSGTSKIHVNDDRCVEFRSGFHFDQFHIGLAHIKQMENMYRVTEEGKLRALSTKVTLGLVQAKRVFALPDTTLEIQGDVINNILEPRLLSNGVDEKLLDLGKINLAQQGNIVNPMHLVNRLSRLYVGQTWKIFMLDPFRGVTNQFVGDIAKQGMSVPSLIAEVQADTLRWDRKEVDCYKIVYHEAGKDVVAKTWVRKRDGLVLQQEASHFGFDLVLQRIPN